MLLERTQEHIHDFQQSNLLHQALFATSYASTKSRPTSWCSSLDLRNIPDIRITRIAYFESQSLPNWWSKHGVSVGEGVIDSVLIT